MWDADVKLRDLTNKFKFRGHDLDNRLGAVYQAVHEFIEDRSAEFPKGANLDKVSLVLFNHRAEVIFENRDMGNPDELLGLMLPKTPSGSTDYDVALEEASRILKTNHNAARWGDLSVVTSSVPL